MGLVEKPSSNTNISPHRGGWKKYIGGKRFYSHVGQDRESFQQVAAASEIRWQVIKARGELAWTKADIDTAYNSAGVTRSTKQTPNPVPCVRKHLNVRKLRLYDAVDMFLEQLRGNVPNQISIDTYEKAKQHVPRLKELLDDRAIVQIDYDDLVTVRNGIINGKKVNGEPFAVDTITTIVATFKSFFNYLADSDRWLPPRGFDRALKVDRANPNEELRRWIITRRSRTDVRFGVALFGFDGGAGWLCHGCSILYGDAMQRPEEIEGYEIPLHVSLTQPVLMGGVPRTFSILNGTMALVVGMGLHLWWLGFPAGALLHAAAVLMSKRDPHWFDIFRKQLRQATHLDS